MSGSTLRWLFRETWRPFGGPSTTRFSAPPGSHTIPDDEWTDNLAGGSHVEHERIGLARMPARRQTPEFHDFEEFREWIEEECLSVTWDGDWVDEDDEEGVEQDAGLSALFDGVESEEDVEEDDDE